MGHDDIIISRLEKAETLYLRLRGLLGRKSLEPDSGLLIRPCNQIHTFFMKFPIDVVFLDKNGTVLKLYSGLQPWRMTSIIFKAKSVLELAQGKVDDIAVGDKLLVAGKSIVHSNTRKSL